MDKKSEKKKDNKGLPAILFIVLSIAIGIVLGIFMNGWSEQTSEKMESTFTPVFVACISYLFSYYIQVIAHEGGHFIGGLISGYKFLSFRIGSLIFVKEDGKLVKKKYKVPGTAGQCLMLPTLKDGSFPFKLYLAGGALANLILSVPALIIFVMTDNPYVEVAACVFMIIGFFLFLINIVPMRTKIIINDGYNIILYAKDKEARNGFYSALRMYSESVEGKKIRELKEYIKHVPDGADLSSVAVAQDASYELQYYMDIRDFENAKAIAMRMTDANNNVLGLFRNEALCELLFMEIIDGCDAEKIEKLYDKKLQNYIRVTSCYLSRKRLMHAYYLIYKKNAVMAKNELDLFNKTVSSYPCRGEALSEKELIEWVDVSFKA